MLTVVRDEGWNERDAAGSSPLVDEIVREGARPILAEALQAEVDAYIARCRAVVAHPPGSGVPFPGRVASLQKTVGAEAAPPLLTQLQELASLNVRRSDLT
jgi:hypothetical protein